MLQLAFAAYLGQFRIEFRSHQHGKTCPIQPDHQCNCRGERSVGFVEVREMAEINPEQIRQTDPAAHSKNRTGQGGQETLLDVWSEEVT